MGLMDPKFGLQISLGGEGMFAKFSLCVDQFVLETRKITNDIFSLLGFINSKKSSSSSLGVRECGNGKGDFRFVYFRPVYCVLLQQSRPPPPS